MEREMILYIGIIFIILGIIFYYKHCKENKQQYYEQK